MTVAQVGRPYWLFLPPAIWALVIWLLGGDDFSAPQTSRFLGPFVSWLFPDIDYATRREIVAGIRKLAHPGVYGILAGLMLNAVARTVGGSPFVWGLASLVPVALLAIADEWRQSASVARTGAAFDVFLDVAGGIFVVLVLLALDRQLRGRLFRRRPTPASNEA